MSLRGRGSGFVETDRSTESPSRCISPSGKARCRRERIRRALACDAWTPRHSGPQPDKVAQAKSLCVDLAETAARVQRDDAVRRSRSRRSPTVRKQCLRGAPYAGYYGQPYGYAPYPAPMPSGYAQAPGAAGPTRAGYGAPMAYPAHAVGGAAPRGSLPSHHPAAARLRSLQGRRSRTGSQVGDGNRAARLRPSPLIARASLCACHSEARLERRAVARGQPAASRRRERAVREADARAGAPIASYGFQCSFHMKQLQRASGFVLWPSGRQQTKNFLPLRQARAAPRVNARSHVCAAAASARLRTCSRPPS